MMNRNGTSDFPRPLVVVMGSAAIIAHLLAVVVVVLAAPSGPWPSPNGGAVSTPPQFAYSLSGLYPATYLRSIGMSNNYHFLSNRPGLPGVSFEVRLKDALGKELSIVKIPDPDRNFSVRHRQSMLARALADDQPVEPPQGEMIAAPNRGVPTVRIWEMGNSNELVIQAVPQHLVPRDRPVFSPSERSLLLARSYARHLCRVHGAAKAEVIRYTREPIPPAVLFISGPPPSDTTGRLVSNFGELSQ